MTALLLPMRALVLLLLCTTGSHTDFWLDVQERNGSHQRWPLAFHDSRPEILAQYIIEAYARYRPQL